MQKAKNQNLNTPVNSGTSRIDEIKSTIASLRRKVCKAEVYETWDNIFDPEEPSEG